MKYLLLDTNIYLNIAVNRRKDVNSKLLKTFSKLLQYGEIRIILPAIIKHETFKHLEDEISKVGTNLEGAKKAVEESKALWSNAKSPRGTVPQCSRVVKWKSKIFKTYEGVAGNTCCAFLATTSNIKLCLVTMYLYIYFYSRDLGSSQ